MRRRSSAPRRAADVRASSDPPVDDSPPPSYRPSPRFASVHLDAPRWSSPRLPLRWGDFVSAARVRVIVRSARPNDRSAAVRSSELKFFARARERASICRARTNSDWVLVRLPPDRHRVCLLSHGPGAAARYSFQCAVVRSDLAIRVDDNLSSPRRAVRSCRIVRR